MMNTSEILERLRLRARSDGSLRRALLETREETDPLKAFCDVSTRAGYPISPMELIVFGEESYAAMRRSTNGGGENSPLLEWEDDYYELMMAELLDLETRVDLHMHSTCSDGADTPEQLLEKLRRRGIRTFALTDHDTMDGVPVMERLIASGEQKKDPLRFIPGVEFSCRYDAAHWQCHILGLGADPAQPAFAALLRRAKEIRIEKMNWRFAALEEVFGIRFLEEKRALLLAGSSPGKPHIAAALVREKWEKEGRPIDQIETSSKVREAYLNEFQFMMEERLNCLGRLSRMEKCGAHMEPEEAISGILLGGGIPVWAHPFGEQRAHFANAETVEQRLQALLPFGLRGLECYYSQYEKKEVDFLLGLAEKYHLLVSGGSDYHGLTVKPNRLGELNVSGLRVTEEMLTVLRG